jgi:hypothetical protein
MTRSTTVIHWRPGLRDRLFRSAKSTPPKTGGNQTADKAAGSDTSTDNAGDGDDPPSDDQTGEGDAGKPDPKTDKKHSDADMAAARRRWQKEADDRVAKATQDAADEKLKAEGKATELAERYKTQLDATTPKMSRYEEIVNAIVDSQIKEWPESLKKLVPADGDPIARYTAFESGQDAAREYLELKNKGAGGTGGGAGNGTSANRENPPASRQQNRADDDADPEAYRGQRRIMASY